MEYGETIDSTDEVEDLFVLLKKVKELHPEVMGVTSGAINSTYQKNRVENICERLGMTSIAPLWEVPPVPLLQQMVDSGMESILIKVATMGLKLVHLGKTLGEMQPKLLSLE